ncbi:MAG TPA: lipid-A-disaccharide synthase [Bacteroidales bacterium]|nr:lipid-A-disaccharide synthase [Bacteroidales bacterium]
MKYFIIAGEQSGDLHGSNLVKAIFENDEKAEIQCWGGDLMESAGAKLLVHYKETAFMGFVAVLKNIGKISDNFNRCKKQVRDFHPDVVIFIDYPGFNLRMAAFAKKAGFRTFYYISPKFWAWNESRVEKVKKYIDRMFIIFPFEINFYRVHGIDVQFFGNPLVDEVAKRSSSMPSKDEIRKSLGIDVKPVIALLAGSRKHEIEFNLPEMLKIIPEFPGFRFIIAGVKNIDDSIYNEIISGHDVKLVKEATYELLYLADAAIVTSGTATLEAALHGTPQVVCYKGDFISMLIGWMVIRVKHISLVNLIMNEEVVKELLQYDLTKESLVKELKAILPGGERREKMLIQYGELKNILGAEGASGRIAFEMIKELRKKSEN